MDDAIFLGVLRQEGLLPGDLREQIEAKDTNAKKAELFLDKMIERSLNSDILKKLFIVMRDDNYVKHDTLKQLAARIEQELYKFS